MMAAFARATPSNSLVLIADPSSHDVPDTLAGSLIAATGTCIAVGCRSEADGETSFSLGTTPEVDPGMQPAFEGTLKTPSCKVAIRTVIGETILDVPVSHSRTVVRVWVDDPKEPDKVIVGVD